MSDKTRNLRYKRPALASMGAYNITQELDDIVEACNGVRYYIEQADNDETLLMHSMATRMRNGNFAWLSQIYPQKPTSCK